MTANQIEYALAKQVPDMQRGFCIHTNYGDLDIAPGPMAYRITKLVATLLTRELRKQRGRKVVQHERRYTFNSCLRTFRLRYRPKRLQIGIVPRSPGRRLADHAFDRPMHSAYSADGSMLAP